MAINPYESPAIQDDLSGLAFTMSSNNQYLIFTGPALSRDSLNRQLERLTGRRGETSGIIKRKLTIPASIFRLAVMRDANLRDQFGEQLASLDSSKWAHSAMLTEYCKLNEIDFVSGTKQSLAKWVNIHGKNGRFEKKEEAIPRWRSYGRGRRGVLLHDQALIRYLQHELGKDTANVGLWFGADNTLSAIDATPEAAKKIEALLPFLQHHDALPYSYAINNTVYDKIDVLTLKPYIEVLMDEEIARSAAEKSTGPTILERVAERLSQKNSPNKRG